MHIKTFQVLEANWHVFNAWATWVSKHNTHQNMASFRWWPNEGLNVRATQTPKHNTHQNMSNFKSYVSIPCPHGPCAPHQNLVHAQTNWYPHQSCFTPFPTFTLLPCIFPRTQNFHCHLHCHFPIVNFNLRFW